MSSGEVRIAAFIDDLFAPITRFHSRTTAVPADTKLLVTCVTRHSCSRDRALSRAIKHTICIIAEATVRFLIGRACIGFQCGFQQWECPSP